MRYFVIPLSERLVEDPQIAAPSRIEYRVREVFQLAGKPAPAIFRIVGIAGMALGSFSPETEEEIYRAAEEIAGDKCWITQSDDVMLQWVHSTHPD